MHKLYGLAKRTAGLVLIGELLLTGSGTFVAPTFVFAMGRRSPGEPGVAGSVPPSVRTAPAGTALGADTILILSSLQSALDQLQGIQSQIKVKPLLNQSQSEILNRIKQHTQLMEQQTGQIQATYLVFQRNAQKLPEVSNKARYRLVSSALDDVERFMTNWRPRASTRDYWKDLDQVRADLDLMERRLEMAIHRTQDFGSDVLKLKFVG